jgi:hypothetical protein
MAELRSANLSERLRLDPLRHIRALEAACHLIADEGRPGYNKAGKFNELHRRSMYLSYSEYLKRCSFIP